MYIARQAIFDRKLRVFGYELLFRKEKKSTAFDGINSMQATASVLGGLFEAGINNIVDNRCAFINFDENLIYLDSLELIAPGRLVIEVLEDIEVSDQLVERLKELKSKGYKIALDDFVENYETYPLVPYANIIKFDLLLTPLETILPEIKLALSQNKILLAEKIEDAQVYSKAKDLGFHLFQGYFFSKPDIIGKSSNREITKTQFSRIMAELKKQEPSYQVLAELIEQDADLAYRVVRMASTRSKKNLIYSIKWALTYMGFYEIERWVNVLMLQKLGDNKPEELMRLSLIRSKFAELCADSSMYKNIKHEAALMGLFSTIDAMLNQTMSSALENIALSHSITDALLYKKGILIPIYMLVINYEKAEWGMVEELSSDLKIKEEILNKNYLASVKWARNAMDFISDSTTH